jgi:hypothetical protein
MQTRLCGGIPDNLIFLVLFLSRKKVQRKNTRSPSKLPMPCLPTLRHHTQKHNSIQPIMFLLSHPAPDTLTSHCQPRAKKWLTPFFCLRRPALCKMIATCSFSKGINILLKLVYRRHSGSAGI